MLSILVRVEFSVVSPRERSEFVDKNAPIKENDSPSNHRCDYANRFNRCQFIPIQPTKLVSFFAATMMIIHKK